MTGLSQGVKFQYPSCYSPKIRSISIRDMVGDSLIHTVTTVCKKCGKRYVVSTHETVSFVLGRSPFTLGP